MIATQFEQINRKTRKTRVLNIILILAIGALLTVLFLHFSKDKNSVKKLNHDYEAILLAAEVEIPITIANTDREKQLGLSGTISLPQNQGKLFVFDTLSKPGFWMKDMNYGLDLVWLDKNFRIVDITKNVYPESYPEVFYPKKDVLYVLEVNAGFSTKNNLKENQLLTFSNKLVF
jgi:uncharacterized membrane protein (UPF0127 family)